METGTAFTFRALEFLTGQNMDAGIECPRCGRFVFYDGRECSCVCKRWTIGRFQDRGLSLSPEVEELIEFFGFPLLKEAQLTLRMHEFHR